MRLGGFWWTIRDSNRCYAPAGSATAKFLAVPASPLFGGEYAGGIFSYPSDPHGFESLNRKNSRFAQWANRLFLVEHKKQNPNSLSSDLHCLVEMVGIEPTLSETPRGASAVRCLLPATLLKSASRISFDRNSAVSPSPPQKKPTLAGGPFLWWRWWESNPRPKKNYQGFLRA